MPSDPSYEVRNRHGDVVQRGQLEVLGIGRLPFGIVVEIALYEPARLRLGDSLSVDLNESDSDQ